MSEYQFTQSWFDAGEKAWPALIPLLNKRQNMLEIGSFEGRSSVWIAEHMLEDGGTLFCVDNWKGGEEHGGEDMPKVEKRFDSNRKIAKAKFPQREILKLKKPSTTALSAMVASDAPKFDFIYIDGSHKAPDVLSDIVMAWPLLKVGGIMVFDDYLWGNARDALHKPKIAIDAFTTIYGEALQIVLTGYQLAVCKTQ